MNSFVSRAMGYGMPSKELEDTARATKEVIWICFTGNRTGITVGERQWDGKNLPEAYENMMKSIKEQGK